jgi:acetyltransferase-like isoleucine patch superfamily enzyme
MRIDQIFNRIQRIIAEHSSSDQKIKYLRKQGVFIGNNCHLETMSFSTEPYLVEMGDHVAIANGTVLVTHDGGISCFRDEFPGDDIFGKILIGNNVHIGVNCTILPNTIIGDNCIVGAGSVLRGRFPGESVIVGNPAKVIMSIQTQKFLFKVNPNRLHTEEMTDPGKRPIVIDHFASRSIL